MSSDVSIGQAVIAECERRLFEELLPRLEKCLAQLTEEEVWLRANPQSNAVGNLVLHLSGNVGQWINSTLGGAPDHRARDSEFSERGPISKTELLARLTRTLQEARAVIAAIDPACLAERRIVQGFDETVAGILIHVVEHFSYHTGQIAWFVKARKAVDLEFYGGVDLNKTAHQ